MSGGAVIAAVAGACLALGVAGGSMAAKQVTGADIKDGTITTKDVKNRTLTTADFGGSVQGAAGEVGPTGAAGPPGAGVKAGYSWAFKLPHPQVPAMSTGSEIIIKCPVGTTVLGGSGFWETPMILMDSSKVPGQESWRLYLANPGNTPVEVNPYVWCSGLSAPTLAPA